MDYSNLQSQVSVFDKTLQKTHEWLRAIMDETGWEDEQKAYTFLRAVLHTLRDRLIVDEAAHLSSQLPLLLKGTFYENWDPSRNPSKDRNVDDFVNSVQRNLGRTKVSDVNLHEATRSILKVVSERIGGGEILDVLDSLPTEIRQLFGEGKRPGMKAESVAQQPNA